MGRMIPKEMKYNHNHVCVNISDISFLFLLMLISAYRIADTVVDLNLFYKKILLFLFCLCKTVISTIVSVSEYNSCCMERTI